VEDALHACVAAARLRPTAVGLWRRLDRWASASGRHRLAFDACRQVCTLAPDAVGSWRRLAVSARRAREPAAADEAIDRWYAKENLRLLF
jgi:predicted TPR repeat methyltransferase